MSLPSAGERLGLNRIADELHETFSARGHQVGKALDVDPAFGKRSGHSKTYLERDLVLEAVDVAGSQTGLPMRSVKGGGYEIVGGRHRYRILRGRRSAEGELVVLVGSDSTLILEEDDGLFPLESWIFCWVRGEAAQVAEIVAAEIQGKRPGIPGRLILGPGLSLGSGGPSDRGFVPSDEDLDLGDEEGEGGAAGDLTA